MTRALYFDEVQVGASCISPSYEVTEARVMAYAELTGDFTPVHTDEAYAKTTPFGTRVAHGLFGLSIADGLKTTSDLLFQPGMSLGWEWSFAAPIFLGDSVRVKFHVASKRESKSRPGWGILVLPSELINQRDEVVQKGEHRVMIPMRSV
jgi:acyl dehydratase